MTFFRSEKQTPKTLIFKLFFCYKINKFSAENNILLIWKPHAFFLVATKNSAHVAAWKEAVLQNTNCVVHWPTRSPDCAFTCNATFIGLQLPSVAFVVGPKFNPKMIFKTRSQKWQETAKSKNQLDADKYISAFLNFRISGAALRCHFNIHKWQKI